LCFWRIVAVSLRELVFDMARLATLVINASDDVKCCATTDAEHAEDKRMTTYVYDYPSGSMASFCIDGEYVFPMSGTQPAFWINGEYWYPNPPTGTPAFRVSGKFVYEQPASITPRYYLS
jgi:hypothetical protein